MKAEVNFIQDWRSFDLEARICGVPEEDRIGKKCCKKYKRKGKRCKSCPDR